MRILILGGTGAIGVPLVSLLANKHQLIVSTRTKKEDKKNIKYIQGNAKEPAFLNSLLNEYYDAIIDFMVYSSKELKERLPILLDNTNQYFFFSSSRCYANSDKPITEDSPRLVDVCMDPEYLSIDEYGMAKGREENLLRETGKINWTIIRPYITYNSNRIQLGVYEKENWLRRALEGKTIVFPKDIASKKTSLTYGPDVANAIIDLIGNKKAYGQAFHITINESYTWGEILEFYCIKIQEITGMKPIVKFVENSKGLMTVWNKWQIKYDRLYDRQFDNSKIESVRGKYKYKPTLIGLEECLREFISNPVWIDGNINVKYEAWCDKQCGEWTPLREISGKRNKIQYIRHRLLGGM